MSRTLLLVSLLTLGHLGCSSGKPAVVTGVSGGDPNQSLPEARKTFKTNVIPDGGPRRPLEHPPAGVFSIVQYDAPVGKLPAYLTPDPRNGKKNPAIIWITGGDCNSISDVWSPATEQSDETAAAFRQAGIVMLFPGLRGGNENAGIKEGFLGEVDDVLAARKYLATLPYVDPNRIYLGGHSTGGTLAFLVAASTSDFRAVFSFGPVDDVGGYDKEYLPFERTDSREVEMRSPIRWTHSVRSPVFVFEGTSQGNLAALNAIAQASKNPLVRCYPVPGKTHFSLLSPLTRMLALKILADEGEKTNITVTETELSKW